MKKYIFLLLAFNFLLVESTYSQVFAGSGYSGLYISDPNVNLSVSTVGNTVSGMIDLNCDSFADIRVDLHRGATMVDAPNTAYLFVLNPAFEICGDTGLTLLRNVNYFNFGDSLICPSSSYWANDTIYKLGNFGCMDCTGPFSVSNLFIAYRNISTSQIGWIKISFDLNDPSPIELTIPEALSPCISTSLISIGASTCGVFTYTYTITPPSCDGACNGSISITSLSGGTPSYFYNWAPGSPTGDGTPTISNLCSSLYTLNFMDVMGNFCTDSFNLPNGPQLIYALTVSDVSCFGVCDGAVSVTVTGGTGPYYYSWCNGSTTPSNSMLCPGSCPVTITDNNGCEAIDTAFITEPAPIQVTETVTNASCSSCCDGSIQLTPYTGIPPFTYDWFPGSPIGDGTPMISSLCPYDYSYCVTDMNGCQLCDSVIISFTLTVMNSEPEDVYNIFPNPANSFIDIETEGINVFKSCIVSLFDVMGNLILEERIMQNKIRIILPEISNGIYFILFKNEDKITCKKLVKQ